MCLIQQQQQQVLYAESVSPEGEFGLGLVPERAVAGEAASVAAGEATSKAFLVYD
jgi:hypothetical protein